MTTHTPGKWERYAGLIWSPTGHAVICEISEPRPKSNLLKHIPLRLGSPDRKEAEANADLLVKAWTLPALLEACEALVKNYVRHTGYDVFEHPEKQPCVIAARAAIAAAKGEAQ